jgi:thiamine-phosphate diphosphorylase
MIGGDALLAREIGADGLHLRADQLRLAPERGRLLVSASCHSVEELERAATIGADVALLGPAYPTESHPGAAALGPAEFKQLAARAPLPVLAIGGVDETNAAALAAANVAGLAAIGAFAPK